MHRNRNHAVPATRTAGRDRPGVDMSNHALRQVNGVAEFQQVLATGLGVTIPITLTNIRKRSPPCGTNLLQVVQTMLASHKCGSAFRVWAVYQRRVPHSAQVCYCRSPRTKVLLSQLPEVCVVPCAAVGRAWLVH